MTPPASPADPVEPVRRVELTPAAEELLQRLADRHGPLMFHQSGGCCDGSSPMCYLRGEFRVGGADVLLGRVAGDTPFWMSASQFAYWRHTHLTVDVVAGRGSGFSLEAPEGVRFLLRSRLLTDDEVDRLAAQPAPRTGADASVT
ncbi:hypothetical protein SAMN05216223_12782 [Actinacidiphila yanglinensis]|uniref:DUF779 domain-containing protein n=1 Tax=Actinacidiphila yanglinensis TaxID=310779 RepID=A0A1H6E7R7_9ACTN|nr:DUF779 domain-containing protein [Actinacidiphila yanglinensis]SEG93293.1 hypothetical protein SAMN05216223_12782 [Actinacidiphila yanglinensis]